jgi:hypothetical protein
MDMNPLLAAITPQARNEPNSGILVAVNHGFGRPEVIPLWAGEGNVPTPEPFARAASESLLKGETFYTWQRAAFLNCVTRWPAITRVTSGGLSLTKISSSHRAACRRSRR